MKSNSVTAAAEKQWRQVTEVMEDNLVLFLQVLHEEYHFGDKRLHDILYSVFEKAKKFDEAAADGVLDIKTEYERVQFHNKIHDLIKLKAREFMPTDIYDFFYVESLPTNNETRRQEKKKEKNRKAISIKEVTELHEAMRAVRKSMGADIYAK